MQSIMRRSMGATARRFSSRAGVNTRTLAKPLVATSAFTSATAAAYFYKCYAVPSCDATTITTTTTTRADRAAGALMGVLIGDALGAGMQWYYDVEQKEKDHGSWVTGYVDPKLNGEHFFASVSTYRAEQGFTAGDTSQMGEIFSELLSSVAENGNFDRVDFFARLDKLMATLSGESLSGRYTDAIIKELRKKRQDGIEWDDKSMGTAETTSDGAVLAVILAAIYADPKELVVAAESLIAPLLSDNFIRSNSIVFALTVQALINGVAIKDVAAHVKKLGFDQEIRKFGGAFDNFLSVGHGASASKAIGNAIAPKTIAQVYGDDCQFTHLVPSAYFLAHHIADDFEYAVLSASNSSGQNVVRAALTGALSGASNGLLRIPPRFIEKLHGGVKATENAKRVASLCTV